MALRSSVLVLSLGLAVSMFGEPHCEDLRTDLGQPKLLKQANDGDDSAQLRLGRAYECEDDLFDAAVWYRRAADRGNAAAQNNLGALYADGKGVPRDDNEAFKLFLRAATAGLAPAQMNVGIMFGRGSGTRRSDEAAANWFAKAVSHKYYAAFTALGKLYLHGRGVARNDEHAFRLFLTAAEHGDLPGQEFVSLMYSRGRGTLVDMKRALEWGLKAAAAGSPRAENNLGYLFEHGGNGMSPDFEQAVKWYQLAGEHGVAQAEYNLALMYRDGKGVEKNLGECRRLLASATLHGFNPPDVTEASTDTVASLDGVGTQAK